jgi:hypothetical protein
MNFLYFAVIQYFHLKQKWFIDHQKLKESSLSLFPWLNYFLLLLF